MIVEATKDGPSAVLSLGEGKFVGSIEASVWDGASATLQESIGNEFVACDDPYNAGSDLTRTANGQIFQMTGGAKYRLNVSSYGSSTAGLKLIIQRSGS